MNPQVLHLSHPQEDALLVGGVIIVLALTFGLSMFSGPGPQEALLVANTSQNVTAFMQQHPNVTSAVNQVAEQSYVIRYESSDGNSIAVDVDLQNDQVVSQR